MLFEDDICYNCDLHKNCRTPDIKPVGSLTPDVYILNEYPSEREDLTGKYSLSSKPVYLIVNILEHFGIKQDKIRYYNATNCKPKKDEIPSDIQINACKNKIIKDIKDTKPRVIIACGNSALKSLFDKCDPGIAGWRGWQIPSHDLNCWIVPVFNPQKIIDDGIPDDEKNWVKQTNYTDTLKVLKEDLSIVPDLIKTIIFKNKSFKIKKLLKFNDVINFFDNIVVKYDKFTIDFETIGKKPYFPESCILSVSISFDNSTSYAFPVSYSDYFNNNKYWNIEQEKEILKRLKLLLSRKDITKIVHNLIFETEWSLSMFDIWLENLEDTMLQKYILDCRTGTMNLDFLAFATFGIRWKKYPDYIMNDLRQLNIDELLEYNGTDTIFEQRLYDIQNKYLDKDKILKDRYYEQIETARSIAKIQFMGACTNEESRNNLAKDFKEKKESLEKEIYTLNSVKIFENKFGRLPSLKSNSKDVATIIFDIEKLDSFKKTKKGNVAVDKEVLNKFAERGSLFCDILPSYREYSSAESKMLKSYTECVYPDGKYHSSFRFVETGRLGSKDINLQNLDKRKHPEIRQLICAPPGHVLIIYDFAQLEARIIAALSNCTAFINHIIDGYDIHLGKAIEIYGEDVIKNADKKLLKLLRFNAKNSFVFPTFYGSRPKATANRLGISEDRAQTLYDKLWSDYPEIKVWQDEVLKMYDNKRYVEIPPGRRRYAPLKINQRLNTPVQGASSSIVCKAMNTLVKRGYWVYLNCHDELITCSHEKEAKFVSEEMQEIMTSKQFDFMRNVPLDVEGTIGYDWYQVVKVEEVLSPKYYKNTGDL